MVEAAERLQRHGVEKAARRGRHLEHPSMVLPKSLAGTRHILFATEPTAPGGDTAGAVADGTGQAQILGINSAGPRVPDQGRRAARKGALFIPVERFCDAPPCPGRPVREMLRTQLVVAHQNDATIGCRKAPHAVEPVGHPQAVGHQGASLRDHAVREAVGQIEQALRIGPQGAKARR